MWIFEIWSESLRGCKCMEGQRWEVANRLPDDILFEQRARCHQLDLPCALASAKTEILASC